jgi:hypothetical protein
MLDYKLGFFWKLRFLVVFFAFVALYFFSGFRFGEVAYSGYTIILAPGLQSVQ